MTIPDIKAQNNLLTSTALSHISNVFVGYMIHSPSINEFRITDSALGLNSKGKIEFIEAKKELDNLKAQYNFCDSIITTLEPTQFLIPGFIDTHIHAAQWENRGIGMDLELLDWLNRYTFPTEARFKDADIAQKIYTEVVKNTLKCGTTTACYFTSIYTESTKIMADIVDKIGQRALIGKVCMDANAPDYYSEVTESSLSGTMEVVEYINKLSNPLILPVLTPRFALTSTRQLMDALGKYAKENDLHIQSHLAENKSEVALINKKFPEAENYTSIYMQHGLLTKKTIMAHSIYIDDGEIEMLKDCGVGIAHCPVSNFALQSGIMDSRKLLDKNVKLGLGTDVSGGYSASILEVARQALTASISLKFQNRPESYKPLTYKEVFYLATMGGAKVLCLDHLVGSFEFDKDFDALLISTEKFPVDPYPTDNIEKLFQRFMYNGDDRNILQVWVCGKRIKLE